MNALDMAHLYKYVGMKFTAATRGGDFHGIVGAIYAKPRETVIIPANVDVSHFGGGFIAENTPITFHN